MDMEGAISVDNNYLERLFPAFLEIGDQELRERSERAMAMAMEQGGRNEANLADVPVTLRWKGCDVGWIEHVTDVTRMCILEFDQMKKYYLRHGVPFDRDIVVAGALLHDIGKLTEFVPGEGGGAVHSENYQLMRHPLSGALIAARAGLPDSVVHLIATHSFEGERSYQTLESDFVRTVDIFVFNCSVKGLEKY